METSKHAAESLLTSLRGIARACVDVDAHGRVQRVAITPADGTDDRSAQRNAQSALMAVLGQNVDINGIVIQGEGEGVGEVVVRAAPIADGVLELHAGRRGELNEAARVAFETLRTAQANFHGFQFDGAELVKIAAHQYVVVAVSRATTDARYCGSAPVIDSVSTASARALMNAVGLAAMGAAAVELHALPGMDVKKA
ncbi:MAG TPA: hypothetical protein VM100_04910 [Longimicrobiales bacterium]|nr:hypothetical protein [Longimicrobiales bacterium]